MKHLERDIQVTNRVFKGSLGHSPDYLELEAMCVLLELVYQHYKGRPTMFVINMVKCKVLIFSSGRFRIMGKVNEEEARDTLVVLGFDRTLCLQLQTETAKFYTLPVTLLFVYRHGRDVFYEGELFPAIQIRRWKNHFVNLFFTGSVVIMGPQASLIAPQVKFWLIKEIGADARKPLTHPRLESDCGPSHCENNLTHLLNYIPVELNKKASDYFKQYPQSLLKSWCCRVRTEKKLLANLIKNIQMF